MSKGATLASNIKYYSDYSKWNEELQKAESWKESVERVMKMHRTNPKLQKAFNDPKFIEYFDFAQKAYEEKLVLGSQRALQFGGEPMMKHQMKMYNCLSSYCDRPEFFQEAMYLLLCGCGVGFSVQLHHVSKLAKIQKRTKGTKTFIVPDSIEGWSDALGVLMSSYFLGEVPFPEYQGYDVKFDFSLIRPKGAYISVGFKAPGPDGLRNSLLEIEQLLEKTLNEGKDDIRPIIAYDIIMHAADAVLSGGVRRSATICLFSFEDKEMLKAKSSPNWHKENPQRGRSNNSVVLVRNETTYEQFCEIFEHIKLWGEPGFIFTDHRDVCFNPCVEIGMWPQIIKDYVAKSGWQGCNLVEGNGSQCTTREKFLRACKALAILGTIQASYTDFKYVTSITKEIFERESLLGCSFTGWTTNPEIMMNPEIQREGARLIKEINKEVAEMIGINPAARTTCSKPSGNASVLLESPSSGCGGQHSKKFFRLMQLNKDNEIAKYLKENQPVILEDSIWSREGTDYVVYVPIEANPKGIFKDELVGIKQLEIVKTIQQNWVEEGTNIDLCIQPFLRHNVSNTVEVEDWDESRDYLFENKEWFAGVSFLPKTGDKDYEQAPFTSVLTATEILEKYGETSIFVSGLIIDGLHAFPEGLWQACKHVEDKELALEGTRVQVLVKKDWVRRVKQFSKRYFKGNLKETIYCLKDVYLFHKWVEINRELKTIDFESLNLKPDYIDADTMGAASCIGGACEIPYMQ